MKTHCGTIPKWAELPRRRKLNALALQRERHGIVWQDWLTACQTSQLLEGHEPRCLIAQLILLLRSSWSNNPSILLTRTITWHHYHRMSLAPLRFRLSPSTVEEKHSKIKLANQVLLLHKLRTHLRIPHKSTRSSRTRQLMKTKLKNWDNSSKTSRHMQITWRFLPEHPLLLQKRESRGAS